MLEPCAEITLDELFSTARTQEVITAYAELDVCQLYCRILHGCLDECCLDECRLDDPSWDTEDRSHSVQLILPRMLVLRHELFLIPGPSWRFTPLALEGRGRSHDCLGFGHV